MILSVLFYVCFFLFILIPSVLSTYFTFRLFYLVAQCLVGTRSQTKSKPIRTLIVLGSGGHTAEMMHLMNKIDKSKFIPRMYVLADTDTTSRSRVESDESDRNWTIVNIPRSRHVNQSYLTSIVSTIYSIAMTVPTVLKFNPDVVLCNGPGTCIPVCFVVFMMRVCHYTNTSIIFVESICRVKSLSLTGKILFLFADLIIVQWPELKEKYWWRVKYLDEEIFS